MSRLGVGLLILLLLPTLVDALSIKDLIAKYDFSKSSPQINVTGYADFMEDRNGNGINDTLVFELTANNAKGEYIFVLNLFDGNNILTNETKANLSSGVNRVNITMSSIFLTQKQFNYSVKIYNSSFSLKFRKDKIPTQIYQNYEEGFNIISASDFKEGKTLKMNITINSSVNGTFDAIAFLYYNNSAIISKKFAPITDTTQSIIFIFDNETIKKTHHIGNFVLKSLRIGKKAFNLNLSTANYDFRDFAASPYISSFTDEGVDENGDDKFEKLNLDADVQIFEEGDYIFSLGIYDLFGSLVDLKNVSVFLDAGQKTVPFAISGSKIYDKKLNGPYVVKYARLYNNGVLQDETSNFHTTQNYNFADFNPPDFPDLIINFSASDRYNYGINNISVNVTVKNIGYKPAFNVFIDVFDNRSLAVANISSILMPNTQVIYSFELIDTSDLELTSIVDIGNVIEELNESNNAEKILLKINKQPLLNAISNISAKETDLIEINLTAFDPNDDNLAFSINSSKFLSNNNYFTWNTTVNDSGEYHFIATVSDGFLNDSTEFDVLIKDAFSNDLDNDGIDDTIDNLIGNEKSVNTSSINLAVWVNGSSNISRIFSGNLSVKFLDYNATVLDFPFNFSRYKLNLTNITIEKQQAGQKGSLFVRGLKMPPKAGKVNLVKAMYVDRVNASLNAVCIKDDQITSIKNISNTCNKKGEVKVKCNNKLTNSYRCTYDNTTNKYKIQNLKHSGAIQIFMK